MFTYIKILVPPSKSLVEVHEFGRIFGAGKAILASQIFRIFWDPPEELGTMAKLKVPSFNSETLASTNPSCVPNYVS